MTDFASGHRAFGSARRSAFSCIHCMSPWWPFAMNSRKPCATFGCSEGEVKEIASKPSAAAFSEIRVFIIGWRAHPAHALGEYAAHAGARLDERIPALRGFVIFPWHVADIIQCRDVRRGGKVGQRQ